MPDPLSPFISDLRREFYGGSDQSEQTALIEARSKGISFADMVAAVEGVLSQSTEQSDLTAYITAHNNDGSAHPDVIRWGTAGKSGHKVWMQTADPGVQAGHVWIVV
jgi:hypothetical protein